MSIATTNIPPHTAELCKPVAAVGTGIWFPGATAKNPSNEVMRADAVLFKRGGETVLLGHVLHLRNGSTYFEDVPNASRTVQLEEREALGAMHVDRTDSEETIKSTLASTTPGWIRVHLDAGTLPVWLLLKHCK